MWYLYSVVFILVFQIFSFLLCVYKLFFVLFKSNLFDQPAILCFHKLLVMLRVLRLYFLLIQDKLLFQWIFFYSWQFMYFNTHISGVETFWLLREFFHFSLNFYLTQSSNSTVIIHNFCKKLFSLKVNVFSYIFYIFLAYLYCIFL